MELNRFYVERYCYISNCSESVYLVLKKVLPKVWYFVFLLSYNFIGFLVILREDFEKFLTPTLIAVYQKPLISFTTICTSKRTFLRYQNLCIWDVSRFPPYSTFVYSLSNLQSSFYRDNLPD